MDIFDQVAMLKPKTYAWVFQHAQLAEEHFTACYQHINHVLAIHNFATHALIDIGVTQSLVSCEFSKKLKIKPYALGQTLVVKTPSSGLLEAHIV